MSTPAKHLEEMHASSIRPWPSNINSIVLYSLAALVVGFAVATLVLAALLSWMGRRNFLLQLNELKLKRTIGHLISAPQEADREAENTLTATTVPSIDLQDGEHHAGNRFNKGPATLVANTLQRYTPACPELTEDRMPYEEPSNITQGITSLWPIPASLGYQVAADDVETRDFSTTSAITSPRGHCPLRGKGQTDLKKSQDRSVQAVGAAEPRHLKQTAPAASTRTSGPRHHHTPQKPRVSRAGTQPATKQKKSDLQTSISLYEVGDDEMLAPAPADKQPQTQGSCSEVIVHHTPITWKTRQVYDVTTEDVDRPPLPLPASSSPVYSISEECIDHVIHTCPTPTQRGDIGPTAENPSPTRCDTAHHDTGCTADETGQTDMGAQSRRECRGQGRPIYPSPWRPVEPPGFRTPGTSPLATRRAVCEGSSTMNIANTSQQSDHSLTSLPRALVPSPSPSGSGIHLYSEADEFASSRDILPHSVTQHRSSPDLARNITRQQRQAKRLAATPVTSSGDVMRDVANTSQQSEHSLTSLPRPLALVRGPSPSGSVMHLYSEADEFASSRDILPNFVTPDRSSPDLTRNITRQQQQAKGLAATPATSSGDVIRDGGEYAEPYQFLPRPPSKVAARR